MHTKEGGNVELKRIVTQNLGDGVRPITEWVKLPMGPCKVFFLQMQPKFFTHLKLMWHLMLIMVLLVLIIRLLYNILNLLADVLDPINKPGGFVSF
jgi:hypothetical protein